MRCLVFKKIQFEKFVKLRHNIPDWNKILELFKKTQFEKNGKSQA
jgi:hypothetical protein